MVNYTDITTEERSRKQAKLEYTYQQISVFVDFYRNSKLSIAYLAIKVIY